MKKNFLTFFFALITSSIFALPENERCIAFTENSPFKVTAKGDGILVGACVATTATALALPYILDLPDYDERTYDMNSINDLDRKFARKYNRTIHNAGTVTVAGCYLITPALYLAEYSLGNFDFHEGLMVAVMFAACGNRPRQSPAQSALSFQSTARGLGDNQAPPFPRVKTAF